MRSKYVNEDELRRIFNEGRYFERMHAGEFHERIIRQNRRRTGDRRVRDTMSQLVENWDKFGNMVARVHQYRRKDGSLGGSGRPDPKAVLHDETLYVLEEPEQWDLSQW
jgi:hypothetical protein